VGLSHVCKSVVSVITIGKKKAKRMATRRQI
jgi:hypothetical protein